MNSINSDTQDPEEVLSCSIPVSEQPEVCISLTIPGQPCHTWFFDKVTPINYYFHFTSDKLCAMLVNYYAKNYAYIIIAGLLQGKSLPIERE